MSQDLCPVMLFSGKGGVGKTTLAAATAVRLARLGSRVLIMSTDPAHSLADVFDVKLGSRPIPLAPNLDAMEVDAKGLFRDAIDEGAGESGTIADLLRMVSETPGVDEFGAIEVLLQAIQDPAHDVVILDTAPTGHTLRLLMLPELMDSWIGKLMEMKQRLARAGRFLRRLIPGGKSPDAAEISRGLQSGKERMGGLREMLTDPNKSQIVLVTIPEAMGVLETVRTMKMLDGHGMPIGTVVVNQLQPESPGCLHCQRRRQIHLRELDEMRRLAGPVPIRVLETLPWEVRGLQALHDFGERLWGQPAETKPAREARPD
jgi:arsenite/tail-anchored protein-transporting ATPase